MQWNFGQKRLVQQKVKQYDMPVTFPDNMSPKMGLRIRFDYEPIAFNYLNFFKIISTHPTYQFHPLNLTFQTNDELHQFLIGRGIIYQENDIYDLFYFPLKDKNGHVKKSMEYFVVDTRKIYDVEESVSKYLHTYKYYSINEVAKMLSFSRPTIYKFINDGNLNSVRINGQMRIKHSDLTSFINEENQK